MKTSKALLKHYRERWKAVQAIEQAEARNRSMDERLAQLSVLFEFARSLATGEERDVQEVRDRWVRLKERYCESREQE